MINKKGLKYVDRSTYFILMKTAFVSFTDIIQIFQLPLLQYHTILRHIQQNLEKTTIWSVLHSYSLDYNLLHLQTMDVKCKSKHYHVLLPGQLDTETFTVTAVLKAELFFQKG